MPTDPHSRLRHSKPSDAAHLAPRVLPIHLVKGLRYPRRGKDAIERPDGHVLTRHRTGRRRSATLFAFYAIHLSSRPLPMSVFLLLSIDRNQQETTIRRMRLMIATHLLGSLIARDQGRSLAHREEEIDHSLQLADRLIEKSEQKPPEPNQAPIFPRQQDKKARPDTPRPVPIGRGEKLVKPRRASHLPTLH